MTGRARPKRPAPDAAALGAAVAALRKAVRGLPEVEEGSSYGTPALFVRGKLLARLREDGETLVLRTDFDSRDAMLRARPKRFYLTDHYRGYPAVLVRLRVISARGLSAALADAWEFVAPRSLVKARHSRSRPARDPGGLGGQ